MKNKLIKYLFVAFLTGMVFGCGELDYENKEFFKQEVYIINSESTSAVSRYIYGVDAYVFVDTLKVINDSYDTEFVTNNQPGETKVKFKVGIGGSLVASQDIEVKIAFDEDALIDLNLSKNLECYIPDASKYSTNVPFDRTSETFSVVIPKGLASASLIFIIPILRENITDYKNYAFPLKVVSAEGAPLSRTFTSFLVANLVVGTDKTVDWSGFPIPKLPLGKYHSARLQGNGAENTLGDGIHRTYKFVTKLGDTPDLVDQYMVWGTGVWSFEVFGLHSIGWMYNKLTLNNQVSGTYTLEPILDGNPNFPYRTFNYSTTQVSTDNNKYDPKTKTLTLYYKNVIGQDYPDILTFIEEDFTIRYYSDPAPHNWDEVRARGFKYWLPITGE